MLNFSFCSPTQFEFGRGTENKVGELVKRFGGTKVLLHYGGGSIKESKLYDRVVASLKKERIEFVEHGGVRPNPVSGHVYAGIDIARDNRVDFILAVGGGSVIDSAKAIAAGAVYDGDFWDFYSTGKVVNKALPIGTVLTIAAAGSEGSANSVITNGKTNEKRGASGQALRPRFSVLNPALTETLPPYQTAAGATDIMVHVIERYFSDTSRVEITDRLCEAILKTMLNQVPIVLDDPEDYDARANIMWAGMVAHNNIVGVGREQDWASHGIEHELSAYFGVTHGAGLAVINPAWMKYVASKHKGLNRGRQFALNVFNVQDNLYYQERVVYEGIARWEQFLKSIGMPTTLKELGIYEDDIPKLAAHVAYEADGTRGKYVPLKKADVEEILRLAL